MHRKQLVIALTLGLGLAGALAYAANRGAITPLQGAASTPVAATNGGFAAADVAGTTTLAPVRMTAKPAPPLTDEDVGDAASFGRNVRWLGVISNFVYANQDCASLLAEDPTLLCQPITDTVALTQFNFTDIARITLPANATNSLLCHWFSPRVTVSFFNPTGAPVPGRFSYNPTLTVENPVLADPALIDPTTGAPFNGKLTTSMSASESVQVVVDPGFPVSQNLRDSVVCQAGLISRKALVETYGLTAAQAASFFASPTMVRLNISGSSRYVEYSAYSLGLRIVGD